MERWAEYYHFNDMIKSEYDYNTQELVKVCCDCAKDVLKILGKKIDKIDQEFKKL